MSLKELLRQQSARAAAKNLVMAERPPVSNSREPLAESADPQAALMKEYARLSATVGFAHPHMEGDQRVERFKDFLREKDWPVFALATVIEYMDKKSAEESAAQAGWHWRPLRSKDDIDDAQFGKAAHSWGGNGFIIGTASQANAAQMAQVQNFPASDHYHGPHTERRMAWDRGGGSRTEELAKVAASAEPYDKLVPLHALRKVAEIEAQFKEPVAFFVCDYAPAPHIEYPDPFLMAVINNARLSKGVGRFVIDFWDEPGFGLEQQL